jgi:hypothetical protein
MPYRDIALVSIYGLYGTLYVEKAGNGEGVSVQAEGPEVKVKVVDGCWLQICPEGQELEIRRAARTEITAWGTQLGAVDVITRMRWLTDSGPQVRARTSAGGQAAIRMTAPPGTQVELIDCYGLVKYARGWHRVRGSGRFGIH